jgi:hypothetical protein
MDGKIENAENAENAGNAENENNNQQKTTTIDIDIFIIKTVQEFMFFFSIMFILYYLKKKVSKLTKKRDTEYYIVIGLIVLNIIVNTVKVIIFLKKILENQCGITIL